MTTHIGENPFICKECGAGFAKRSDLMIHLGEKPFDCKECGARISRNNPLKCHMQNHTGEKKTIYLQKMWSRSCNQNQHMTIQLEKSHLAAMSVVQDLHIFVRSHLTARSEKQEFPGIIR